MRINFNYYFEFIFYQIIKKARIDVIVIRAFLSYFLKIPNGFPTGNTTFPKCVFNTAAPEP